MDLNTLLTKLNELQGSGDGAESQPPSGRRDLNDPRVRRFYDAMADHEADPEGVPAPHPRDYGLDEDAGDPKQAEPRELGDGEYYTVIYKSNNYWGWSYKTFRSKKSAMNFAKKTPNSKLGIAKDGVPVKEDAVLNNPHGSQRYADQVRGDEQARPIPGGVLSNPGDAEHPFKGRLVGGGAEESVERPERALDEDYIGQLTREFADFLLNREPVEEAEPQPPAAGAGAAPAAPGAKVMGQPNQNAGAQQPAINPIASQLSKLLGMNASQLVSAYKAAKPSSQQLLILGTAFKNLAAADPQTTAKAMTLLKKISAEETAQANEAKQAPGDTPEDRRRQGRCEECGESLRTKARGSNPHVCAQCERESQLDEHQLDHEAEGHTMKNSLHTVIRMATTLERSISVHDNFPEWVSEKVGAIKGMMVSVADYVISHREMMSAGTLAESRQQKRKSR